MRFSNRKPEPRQPRPRHTAEVLERMHIDSGIPFSVEQDIRPEDIHSAKEAINSLMAARRTWTQDAGENPIEPWSEVASRYVAPIAVVLQNHREQLGLDLMYGVLREELEEVIKRRTKGSHGYYWIVTALVLIAPERRNELQLNDNELVSRRVDMINARRDDKFSSTFCREVVDFASVHPDHVADLKLNEDDWDFQKRIFDRNRQDHELEELCERGMFLRLFYPHHAKELELDGDLWDVLKTRWHSEHPQSRNFWDYAMGINLPPLSRQLGKVGEIGC